MNAILTEEQIQNLFTNAVEGGSNYWCKKIRPLVQTDKRPYDLYMFDGFKVTIDEPIDDTNRLIYEVTSEDISTACDLFKDKYSEHYNDIINENDDASTGDVFLQLCIFKEVVFC